MKGEVKGKGSHAERSQPEHKKHKKRTKLLLKQLKEQVEFYFSDSSLQKDRFLKQAISKHPEGYVEIKAIASFNKMKQMTDDIELVTKAMKASSELELNSDETMVRRTKPIPEAKNVDAETIYIEKLPSHADHDWLRNMFSQFGKVMYVSLPRFKHNGEIKGFAFIEFESLSEAENAVQTFNKDNKRKKEKEEKDNQEEAGEDHPKSKKRRRSHSESEVETCKHSPHKPDRKRLRTISESSADSGENNSSFRSPPNKKATLESNTTNIDNDNSKAGLEGDETGSASDDSKSRKRKKSVHWDGKECKSETAKGVTKTKNGKTKGESEDVERECKKRKSSESESNAESGEEPKEEEEKTKHKRRKRKKKEKKSTTRLPHLRVISKFEWLRLKEQYKALQRQSMQDLKRQLQQNSEKSATQNTQESTQQKPSESGAAPQKPSESHAVTQEPVGSAADQAKDTKKTPSELPFTPGVVLRFQRLDADLTTKDIRKILSTQGPVAYVEMSEDTGEGFARFHTAEKCSAVLEEMSSDENTSFKLSPLTGEEELNYWQKINADRVARFQAKREKKRGTEKVARKVDAVQSQQHSQQVHIRFDE